jgi:SH3-like domain-containing protein
MQNLRFFFFEATFSAMFSLVLLSALLVVFPGVQAIGAVAADDEPVCVISPKAKLHRGPGTNYPVSWTVSQNMPLLKIGQMKSWYQVKDLDGEKHWILANAVSRRISCAVVKTRTAKLRTGPGKEFPSADLAFVDRYTPFKKIDRDGEWVQIQDEYQGKYWVHEDNIWIPMIHSHMTF